MKLRTRRIRHAWFNALAWRRRIAFWGGALVVGLVGVGFAAAADKAQGLAQHFFTLYPLLPFAASPALFALSAWLAGRFFQGSQGSGIPLSIAARYLRDHGYDVRLLTVRAAIGKIVLTLLGLLAGASIGREGPTVQVGSTIMVTAAEMAGLRRERGFILAGAAAGIAAAFNTPLAGLVFAIEEMARAYEHRASGLVLLAVILAGLVSIATVGYYEYFGHSGVALTLHNGWLAVLVLGPVGGLLGGLFARIVLRTTVRLDRWFAGGSTANSRIGRCVGFAAGCGLVVACAGYLTDGHAFGTGYAVARGTLDGSLAVSGEFALAKLVATTASTLSGIPGGLLAPSLSVGAGIGSAFGPLFTETPAGAVAMLGMVAYFVGVTQAPMTGFVLVMEMTGNHGMLVPLMAATMLAIGTSKLICPTPLYHGLALQIIRRRRKAAQPPPPTLPQAPPPPEAMPEKPASTG